MPLIYPSFHFYFCSLSTATSFIHKSQTLLSYSQQRYILEALPWFFKFKVSRQMMRNKRDLASSSPAYYRVGSEGQVMNHPFLSPSCKSFVFVIIIFVPFSFLFNSTILMTLYSSIPQALCSRWIFSVQSVEIH